jgi:small-conductance mechanosensitive channel
MNGGIGVVAVQAATLLAQVPPLPTTTGPESTATSTPDPLFQAKDTNVLIQGFVDFWHALVAQLPQIATGIVIFLLAVYVARLLQHGVERALRRGSADVHAHLVVGKLVYFGFIVIGLVVGLSVAGVNLAVLVGTLGLASVGLGFALSDILSNFVAGIVLLLEHPFTRNDFIITKDAQGIVEDIRVRATVLRTPDGQRVLVPNKLLFTEVLTNASATTRRRLQMIINIPYTEDTTRIRELLVESTTAVDGVEEEPAPQLVTQDFGQGALQLMLWFWVDPRTTDMLRVRSQVLDAIERTLREADVDLAVPTLIEAIPAEELGRRGNHLADLKPEGGPADPEGRGAGPSARVRADDEDRSGGSAPAAGAGGRLASVVEAGGVQEERKEKPR